ncbi:portal protein [Kiloniella litopenaei]|uniref:portal protein n=1 Tax=Kiloniella litopenaei TaxID=1549748 RepID=UPI003BAAA0EE
MSFNRRNQRKDAFCEQATDYVHHCFVTDNKGDEQLYIAFQDALLEKTGIFKAWWQEEEKVEETAA